MNKRANKYIVDYIKNNKTKINVISGQCRFNYKCHMNAVHDALENNDKIIALCVCICDNEAAIHFLNVDSNGSYIDNTLGHWTQKYDHYLIKHIEKKEFFNVTDIFINYRKELKNTLPFLIRCFSNVIF